MLLVESLNKFLKRGETRSVEIKKNILSSILIRGLTVAINFAVVPLTIEYVNPVQYGIWVIISSIISWFSFFDFGMGNGLRNKLAGALAFDEVDQAKKYISTAYATFALIAGAIFLLFCLVNPYINWNSFLNIPASVDGNMRGIFLIVLGTFCIQFVSQILSTVLIALQEPAKAELITLFGQAGLLLTLLILKFTVPGSLMILVIALSVVPATFLVASAILYNRKLKMIAPSFKDIDFKYTKSILNTGSAFFLIQIGALILFQTDNIIITNILGPEAVTKFNVTYKLYSVIYMAFLIIIGPYWSAFTAAYAKKEYDWISASIKKLRKIWLITSLVVIPVFFVVAKFLFRIWLPDTLNIGHGLSIVMAVYVICYTCLALNCYFLNGIGKLRIQLLLYILVSITNIPLGIALGKLWGIEGVIIANIIAFVVMNVVLWIQTNRILQHRAVGIWNR